MPEMTCPHCGSANLVADTPVTFRCEDCDRQVDDEYDAPEVGSDA